METENKQTEVSQEQVRHQMALAYYNVVKERENALIQQIQAVRAELAVCEKALKDLEDKTQKE